MIHVFYSATIVLFYEIKTISCIYLTIFIDLAAVHKRLEHCSGPVRWIHCYGDTIHVNRKTSNLFSPTKKGTGKKIINKKSDNGIPIHLKWMQNFEQVERPYGTLIEIRLKQIAVKIWKIVKEVERPVWLSAWNIASESARESWSCWPRGPVGDTVGQSITQSIIISFD